MNLLIQNRPPKDANLDCADFVTMAERELAAFFSAVAELFGSGRRSTQQMTGCTSWKRSMVCLLPLANGD